MSVAKLLPANTGGIARYITVGVATPVTHFSIRIFQYFRNMTEELDQPILEN